MTISELVRRYGIRDGAPMGKSDALFITRKAEVIRDNMIDEIKARKPEILAYFTAEREAMMNVKAEREAKISAINGLAEIQAAMADLAAWQREFNASFEDEGAVGGLGVRTKPQYDIDGMMKRYPHAAAYLRAKEYADKVNYELSRIGKEALNAVIDGNWESAMVQLDKGIKDYTIRHMWD